MTAPAAHGRPSSPAIAGLLAEELSVLKEFVALLKAEQTALVDGQIEGLPSLTEKKSAIATRLGDLARKREDSLKAAVASSNGNRMEEWLASATADIAAKWQDMQVIAAEARSLNELNGKLIATHLQQTQHALTALLGAAAQQTITYGPGGQAPNITPTTRRSLGSA